MQESGSPSPLAEAVSLVRSLREYLLWQQAQGWDGVPLSAQIGASFQQRPLALKPQAATSRPTPRIRPQTPSPSPHPNDASDALPSLRLAGLSFSTETSEKTEYPRVPSSSSPSPSTQASVTSSALHPSNATSFSADGSASSALSDPYANPASVASRDAPKGTIFPQKHATSSIRETEMLSDLRPISVSSLQTITAQERTERQQRLDAIHADLPQCSSCARQQIRCRQQVLGRGPVEARIMWVYDGPNIEEDLHGQPLQGKAGRLLEGMMRSVGLRIAESYITPIITCRPVIGSDEGSWGKFNPSWEQLSDYVPMLHQKIDVIRPDLIVTLGAKAAQTLHEQKDAKFQSLRGYMVRKKIQGKEYPIFSMFHPVLLLGEPPRKKDAWVDLKVFLSELWKIWKGRGMA